MNSFQTFSDFFTSCRDAKVQDYNNPTCKECNDCCSIFTQIHDDEYEKLNRFLTTNSTGKKMYIQGRDLFNEYLKNGVVYLLCLFSDPNTKRCRIYNTRPSICTDFHCSSGLNRLDCNLMGKNIIGELFLGDLLKEIIKEGFKKAVNDNNAKE